MIGRGRELTVWACKMAYGGLSIEQCDHAVCLPFLFSLFSLDTHSTAVTEQNKEKAMGMGREVRSRGRKEKEGERERNWGGGRRGSVCNGNGNGNEEVHHVLPPPLRALLRRHTFLSGCLLLRSPSHSLPPPNRIIALAHGDPAQARTIVV
jgi:hypothetical protein